MKRMNILFLVVLLPASILAQNSRNSGAESITVDELRDHIYYLASDELEGRFPGTPGYNKVAEYVVTQLKLAGISPKMSNSGPQLSYYQPLVLYKYSPGPNINLTISRDKEVKTFLFEKDFILRYGGPIDKNEFSGEIAFVGYGLKEQDYGVNDFKDLDLYGKWAIVFNPNDKLSAEIEDKLPKEVLKKYGSGTEKRRIIEQNIKDAGGIGMITNLPVSAWERYKMRSHIQYSLLDPKIGLYPRETSLPIISLDSLTTGYLFLREKYNPFKTGKPNESFILKNTQMTLHKEYDRSIINTTNIVAIINGTDPVLKNEYISVGAHLDTYDIQKNQIMNGANDDASGCACLLEIAEAIKESELRRSVILIFFTKEESGYFGSFYFTENPPVSIKSIIVNISLDMVGRSDTEVGGLAPIAADRITPKLGDIISTVSKKMNFNNLNLEFARTDFSSLDGSDNLPFHLKGIPAVYMHSGSDPDYHKSTDDPEKIDYEFLQKNCKFIYDVVMELANGKISLKN